MDAGIDEAGRGPVLGPLVVAGVAGDSQSLWAMGCRDSKRLAPARRERLARLIHAQTRVEVRVIEPEVLDEEMAKATLNEIEARRFQEIALALDCPVTYVDAADVDATRFGDRVRRHLPAGRRVVSEHKADARHATVAAASIIAKVARDQAIDDLRRRLERRLPMELGSGYPSDAKTQAFLAAWVETFDDVPPGTRRSWRTARDLLAPRQADLAAFSRQSSHLP